MIRYVLAVALTTALLAVGFAAVQEGTVVRGESQVEAALTAIENAAVSLLDHDEPVRDSDSPPRRVVDIELPSDGFASESVDTLAFEPVPEADRTLVRYRFGGRSVTTTRLDARLVNASPEADTLELGRDAGSQTVVLELVYDRDREPVIQVTVR